MARQLTPRLVNVLGAGALLLGIVLPWGGVLVWRHGHPPAPLRTELRPEMIEVPAGEFTMGSPEKEEGHLPDEAAHRVRISRSFAIARTEVTQGQYRAVVKQNPSRFQGDDHPVETVSWFDAIEYCNQLSRQEKRPLCYVKNGDGVKWQEGCTGYRLPTEAEWEYAAKAGQSTLYAGSDDPKKVAWVGEADKGQTHPVRQKDANRWGLFDMSGNVWEWVWDFYADDYGKTKELEIDPIGSTKGPGRVYRGGSFWATAQNVRVAYRYGDAPDNRDYNLGFRVARSLP